MRVLCAIVLAQKSRTVSISETHAIKCSTMGSQSVSNDGLGLDLLILH